jgi:flagellar biosynthesis protein FlhB
MADQSGKTEQPTQRRIEKSRTEGQFASAREFISAMQFLALLAALNMGGVAWLGGLRQSMRSLLTVNASPTWGPSDLMQVFWTLSLRHLLPLGLCGMALVVATLAFRLATTQFGFSLKQLAPDLNRLNPISRLQGLPAQNIPALIQAAVLLPVFLWAVYVVVRDRLEAFLTLPLGTVENGAAVLGSSLMTLFWKASGLFMAFGVIDLFRQIKRHRTKLKMSKQEVREEMKDTEGNPQIKAKIRRIRRDLARRNMMKDVPKATAVVVNPTHYAVAIRYQMDSILAPVVLAKGKNYLALRIRQKAIEHQIPIIENPPLAQALYKSADVGQEIPPHLYRAVAEILAYVFKLMNGKLPG